MSLRVRFAPSPTGNLHIGGARTALFNHMLAKGQGGSFILRIEDTDTGRSTPEYEAVILRELRWLDIGWDEGPEVGGPHAPYRQSERAGIYANYTKKLLEGGMAYRCTCSVERLDALRASQEAAKQKPGYDGHCRDKNLGADVGPHVVRLRVPEQGETVVDDYFKGQVSFANEELDDMILVRTDGVPTYNFVVVVDDAHMGITHVLRGDEHLNNTPKQLLIYAALGLTPPRFGHMPLILGPDGSKLSKRHGATSVAGYREMGILPEALINYLTRLGWAHGDMEIFSKAEAVEVFSLDGVGRSPGKWDMDKLLWVNAQWMKRLAPERVAEALRPHLLSRGLQVEGRDLTPVVLALRERARTLVELADGAAFFFQADHEVKRDEDAAKAFLGPDNVAMLSALADHIEGADWTDAALELSVNQFCTERGLKLGKVAQPARVATCGQKVGPGLFQTLTILGKETALRRLRAPAKNSA
ncbi:MAG TPA: glutamate--tRNA ligase [Myxococcota bacterium]|nr:glutamate--tRNA ligase [Myxococcota bacterium]HND31306.1 glutamate--tRNA ligase [Myxococcota bacterium]